MSVNTELKQSLVDHYKLLKRSARMLGKDDPLYTKGLQHFRKLRDIYIHGVTKHISELYGSKFHYMGNNADLVAGCPVILVDLTMDEAVPVVHYLASGIQRDGNTGEYVAAYVKSVTEEVEPITTDDPSKLKRSDILDYTRKAKGTTFIEQFLSKDVVKDQTESLEEEHDVYLAVRGFGQPLPDSGDIAVCNILDESGQTRLRYYKEGDYPQGICLDTVCLWEAKPNEKVYEGDWVGMLKVMGTDPAPELSHTDVELARKSFKALQDLGPVDSDEPVQDIDKDTLAGEKVLEGVDSDTGESVSVTFGEGVKITEEEETPKGISSLGNLRDILNKGLELPDDYSPFLQSIRNNIGRALEVSDGCYDKALEFLLNHVNDQPEPQTTDPLWVTLHREGPWGEFRPRDIYEIIDYVFGERSISQRILKFGEEAGELLREVNKLENESVEPLRDATNIRKEAGDCLITLSQIIAHYDPCVELEEVLSERLVEKMKQWMEEKK